MNSALKITWKPSASTLGHTHQPNAPIPPHTNTKMAIDLSRPLNHLCSHADHVAPIAPTTTSPTMADRVIVPCPAMSAIKAPTHIAHPKLVRYVFGNSIAQLYSYLRERYNPGIPSFVFKVLRTLSFSVSRKSCSCRSYENCRGVYQQFPFWNSILANQGIHSAIPYPLSPNSRICHTSENSPVSPIIATDPKTHFSKSCICHTSDIPPAVTLASPTTRLPRPQAFQRFLQLSPIPFLFAFLRTLLHNFARAKNSTVFVFNRFGTLCTKHPGWGYLMTCPSKFSSAVSPQHQAAPQHVVERLLFFSEPRHDVSDKCRHHVGDNFAKVSSRRAPEADALPRHVRHHQTQHFFPDRGLPLRAFHQCVVQPSEDQAHRCGKKDKSDEREDANVIQVFVARDFAEEPAQSRQKNQRNQYQDEPQTHHHVVNEERQKPQPESRVPYARHGSVSGVRGNG